MVKKTNMFKVASLWDSCYMILLSSSSCSLRFLPCRLPYFPVSGTETAVDSRINHVDSNTLCLPLYVSPLLQKSLAAALGRELWQRRQHSYFWTVCSPAVLSFIFTFAYLSQLLTRNVTSRKKVREKL